MTDADDSGGVKSGNMDRQVYRPHGRSSVALWLCFLPSLPPVSIPEHFNCRRVRNARFYGGEGGGGSSRDYEANIVSYGNWQTGNRREGG